MALDSTPTNNPSLQGARPTPRDEIPAQLRSPRPAIAPLSLALIVASVIVAIYSNLGTNTAALLPLFISADFDAPAPLWEVRHGEIWRLFAPVFIHFGIIHLIFNMSWIKDLGSWIEQRNGSLFLLALAACLAAISNVGQYFVSGPAFGGMSGVVYGLFGYVWLRGVSDPASGFYMSPQTVLIMLGWFLLCWLGVIRNVANTAHGIGLVVGAIWGLVCGRLWPSVVLAMPSAVRNQG